MLKHVVPAHRSSSSLNNSSLSPHPSSFCCASPRRGSLTAVESKSPSCGKCAYRRAAFCGTTSPPISLEKHQIYEGQRGKCDLIREEAPVPGKFPQIEENNNIVDSLPPTGAHDTSRRCPPRFPGPNSTRSFVDMVNRHDSIPRSIHEYDLDYQVNSCHVSDSQERDCRCHISSSSISSYSCHEDETASIVTLDESICEERSGFRTPISDTHSYGSSSPFPYNHSLISKSCTLPRREIMHNEELRRSSFRSNASTCSLLSSVSCSSLSSVKNLNSRSTSTSSLLETVPVKIYLRRLRSDMEYKTVSLSLQTTCKELVVILLTKFRLRHRDPNLFFVLMEVTVRSPSDGAPVKRQLVLEDNARPAELQQCRPKGEANFSIGVRRGGLIRVHDSILMQGSQYKSLMVAYHTTAEELVQLVLKCYNSSENPMNYALHEVCKNPYGDRPLTIDECPLKTQWEWPRNQRNNWAFFLRRNLTYAFSLKSRMLSRGIENQSRTDGDLFDEDSLGASRHSSSPDSRSSSVSSSSSVSRICHSSSPDSRSSVSSTTSVSSGTSVSEKSLDSGFESPFSSVRASEQTKMTLQIPNRNSIESPSSSPIKILNKNSIESPSSSPMKIPNRNSIESPSSSPMKIPNKNSIENPYSSPMKIPNRNSIDSPSSSPMKIPNRNSIESPSSSPMKIPNRNSTESPSSSPMKIPNRSSTESQTTSPMKLPNRSPIDSPTTSPTKEKLQPNGKIPIKDLPPKPKLDFLQKSSCYSFQNFLEKKVAQKPVVVIPKCLGSSVKEETLAQASSPVVKSLPVVPNARSTEASQNTPKSVIPITASVSRLSLNSSLPSVTGTPIPTSTSTPSGKALPPKPRQRTIITITGTTRSPSGGHIELQHRHLRPVIPPPSLKIKSNIVSSPEAASNSKSTKDKPKTETSAPEQKSSSPAVNNKKAEQDLRDVIESLRNLNDRHSQKVHKEEEEDPLPEMIQTGSKH